MQSSHSFRQVRRRRLSGADEVGTHAVEHAQLEPGDGFNTLFKRSKSALWKVSEHALSDRGVADMVMQLRHRWSSANIQASPIAEAACSPAAAGADDAAAGSRPASAASFASSGSDAEVRIVTDLDDDSLLSPSEHAVAGLQVSADARSEVPEGLAARTALAVQPHGSSSTESAGDEGNSVHEAVGLLESIPSTSDDDASSDSSTAATSAAQLALIRILELPPSARQADDIEYLTDYLYGAAPKLFRDLPRSAVQTVARRATMKAFRYNEVLFTQQQRGDTFYLVLHGQVAVYVATGAQAITRMQAAARDYQAACTAYEERLASAAEATAARAREAARAAGKHDLLDSVAAGGSRSPGRTARAGTTGGRPGTGQDASETNARRAAALAVGVSRLPEDRESLRWPPLLFMSQRSVQPPGTGREANEVRDAIRRRQIAAKAACSTRPDRSDPDVAWWLATAQRRETARYLSGVMGQLPPPGPPLRANLSHLPDGLSDDPTCTVFNMLGRMLGYNDLEDMSCALRQPRFLSEEALGNRVVTLGQGAGFGELALLGSSRPGADLQEDMTPEEVRARAEEEDRASRRNATIVAVGPPQFDPATGALLDEDEMQSRPAGLAAHRRGAPVTPTSGAHRDEAWHKRVLRHGVTVLLCIDRATYLESLNVKMRQEIQARVEYLQHSVGIGLFKSWLPRRLAPIAYALQPAGFAMRERLFKRGQPVQGMYFIVEGTVQLMAYAVRDAPVPAMASSLAAQTSNRGVVRRRIHSFALKHQLLEVPVATVGPGGIVAELTPASLLPGAKYATSAVAASSQVRAYFLPQHDVLNLLLAQTDTFVLVHLEAEGRRRARAVRERMQKLGLAAAPSTGPEAGSIAQQYAFSYDGGDELWEAEQGGPQQASSKTVGKGRGGSAAMSAALSAARRAVAGTDAPEREPQEGKDRSGSARGGRRLANPNAPGGVLDPARASSGARRSPRRYTGQSKQPVQRTTVSCVAGSRETELLLHKHSRPGDVQAGLAGLQPDALATATRAVRAQLPSNSDGGVQFAIAPVPSLSSAGQRRTPGSSRGAVHVRVPTARLHDVKSLPHLMVGAASALPLALPPLPGQGNGEYMATQGTVEEELRKPRLPTAARAASQRWRHTASSKRLPGARAKLETMQPGEQHVAHAMTLSPGQASDTGHRSAGGHSSRLPPHAVKPELSPAASTHSLASWHTTDRSSTSKVEKMGEGQDPLDATSKGVGRAVAGSTLTKFKPWAPNKRPGMGASTGNLSQSALRSAGALATARLGPTSNAVAAATGRGAEAAARGMQPQAPPRADRTMLQRVRTEFGARPAPRKLKDTPLSLQRLSQQDYWRRLTAAVGVSGAGPDNALDTSTLHVGESSPGDGEPERDAGASLAGLASPPPRKRRASVAERRAAGETTVIDARMHRVVTDAPARQRRLSMAASQPSLQESASLASGLTLGSGGAAAGAAGALGDAGLDMLPLAGRLLHNRTTASSLHAQMYHRLGGTMDVAALQRSAGISLTQGEVADLQRELADPATLAKLQWDFPAHLQAYQRKGQARRQQYERGAREQDVSAAIKALSLITDRSAHGPSGRESAGGHSIASGEQQSKRSALQQLLSAVGSADPAVRNAIGQAHGRVALGADLASSSMQNMDSLYAQRVLATARKAAARRQREDKRRSMQRLQDQAAWYGGKLPMAATMQTLGELGEAPGGDTGDWAVQTADGFAAGDSTAAMPAWARRMVQSERRLRHTRAEQVNEALEALNAKLRASGKVGDSDDELSHGSPTSRSRRHAAARDADSSQRPWRDTSYKVPQRVLLAQGESEAVPDVAGQARGSEPGLDEWLRTRHAASRRPGTAGGVYSEGADRDGGDQDWRPMSPTGVGPASPAHQASARAEVGQRGNHALVDSTDAGFIGLQASAELSAARAAKVAAHRARGAQRRYVIRGRSSAPLDPVHMPVAPQSPAQRQQTGTTGSPAAVPSATNVRSSRRGPTLTAATLAALAGSARGHSMFEVTAAMDSAAAASMSASAPRWSVGSMAPLYSMASRAASGAQRAASEDVAVQSLQHTMDDANEVLGSGSVAQGRGSAHAHLPVLRGAFEPLAGSTQAEPTRGPQAVRRARELRAIATAHSLTHQLGAEERKPAPPPAKLAPAAPRSPPTSRPTVATNTPSPYSLGVERAAAKRGPLVGSRSYADVVGMGNCSVASASSKYRSPRPEPVPVGGIAAPPTSRFPMRTIPSPRGPGAVYSRASAQEARSAAVESESARSPAQSSSAGSPCGFGVANRSPSSHWTASDQSATAISALTEMPLLAGRVNGQAVSAERLPGAATRPRVSALLSSRGGSCSSEASPLSTQRGVLGLSVQCVGLSFT